MKKLFYIQILLISLVFGQNLNWVPLNSEINGNHVRNLSVYNNQLIACGWFNMAGTVNAHVIAAWDGSNWSNLGGGFRQDDIGVETLTFNNELYLGGLFDSIGNIKVKNIAKWNGSNWSPLGTGSDGQITALAVYNNELYAAGQFSVIGGITARGIARWDGANWHALANGFTTFGASDLYVYNNSLYAVGMFGITGCTACQNIAYWNGINWNGVGTNGLTDATNVALIEMNSKLIIGSHTETSPPTFLTEIRQWDGGTLTMFSKQNSVSVKKFYIFNNELYCSGGSGPTANGESLVSKWSVGASTWIPVGTGPNQSVTGLAEYNGELYCSGSFNTLQSSNLNFIGRLTNVNGINQNQKQKEIIIFPNPVRDKLNIEILANHIQFITLTNPLGQTIYVHSSNSNQIDFSSIPPGVYFLNFQTSVNNTKFKIIKE